MHGLLAARRCRTATLGCPPSALAFLHETARSFRPTKIQCVSQRTCLRMRFSIDSMRVVW
jgi:hypothetical protein